MPISHQCTACGHTFRAPDALGGKLIRCPQCKEPNRVPTATSVAAAEGKRPKRAAPLRRAQSLDVPPQPPAPSPAAVATPAAMAAPPPAAVPPVAGNTGPPAAATPNAEFVAVSAESKRGASPGGGNRAPRRRPRKQTMPVWMWIVIGAMGLGAAGGAAAIVLPMLFASDETIVVTPAPEREKEPEPPRSKAEIIAECRASTVTIHVLKKNAEGKVSVGVGTGFVIDWEKRWVVTNHHVIENGIAARAEFETGFKSRVTGIVVARQKYDIAILKLSDIPLAFKAMKLKPYKPPEVADEVIAIGAPSGLGWTVTFGDINRLLETVDLPGPFREWVREHMKDDGSLDWIQHNAEISPGNSGGPLINDRGEVIGINTLVVELAGMGFAVSVKYLQEMIDLNPEGLLIEFGPGQVVPIPPPKENDKKKPDDKPDFDDTPRVDPGDEVPPKIGQKPDLGRISVSSQRIRQLTVEIAARGWTCESSEQYAQLQDLAHMITSSQFNRDNARIPKILRVAMERESQKALEQLSRFAAKAGREQIEAVNQLAPAAINSPGVGALFFAEVIQKQPKTMEDEPVLILKMIGTEQLAIITVTRQFDKIDVNSRWLVLGVRGDRNLTVTDKGRTKDTYLVLTKQLLRVKSRT